MKVPFLKPVVKYVI
ncbi:hypothetical protein EYZ11_009752 [Aspergillus tanneri]|uniref:Uncharacterized protein n=1 Tax=Aspergillus tanneri TaxID=1220188 RepID=A0A4S3J733_9EURO|nr:hypothetical protein EYZ11_009752 [Aspergillus tanneri]